jgi:hypothetical protein
MNLSVKHASELELARFARDGVDAEALAASMHDGLAAHVMALIEKLRSGEPPMINPQALRSWQTAHQLVQSSGGPAQVTGRPSAAGSRKGAVGRGTVLNIGKAWHILHYLYTGQPWGGQLPAATLLAGGRDVGEDLGYGPGRTVSVAETAAFAQFLSGLTLTMLHARIDMRAMMLDNVYCVDEDGLARRSEVAAEVAHHAPRLAQHVRAAAERQQGLLIWMM